MSPFEAAQLLEVAPDATPEQIEARFHELRTKLEEKIGKAPTPGLKAKYRESLEEITRAFETLTLAADASALPVLQRQKAEDRGRTAEDGGPRPVATPAPVAPSRPASGRKSGSKEFVIVAIIAVVLLAVGGWWVVKTRAENAEKARIATEAAALAKAEAERQAQIARETAEKERLAAEAEKARLAAEARAEQERQEKRLATLRSRLAELNVTAEALFREEPTRAARLLSDLKSDERSLGRDGTSAALNRIRARLDAQQRYVNQVEALIGRHPAKLAQARATELLSAQQPDEAEVALKDFATHLKTLEATLAAAQAEIDQSLIATLAVVVDKEHANVAWTLTDAFGEKHTGTGSRQLDRVAPGAGEMVFQRPGWAAQRTAVTVRAGQVNEVRATFSSALMQITSTPAGASFRLGNGATGTTPATVEVIPGPIEATLSLPGFQSQRISVKAVGGETVTAQVAMVPNPLITDDELEQFISTLPRDNVASDVPYAEWEAIRAPFPSTQGQERVAACLLSFRPMLITGVRTPPTAVPAWFGNTGRRAEPARREFNEAMMSGLRDQGAASVGSKSAPFGQNGDGYIVINGLLDRNRATWATPPKVIESSNPALAEMTIAWLWNSGLLFQNGGPAPRSHSLVYLVVKYRNPSR